LIFFERVRREKAVKGFLKFQGYGVARAELIAQHDQALGRSFANYVYDFAVLDLAPEGEQFDWKWVNDRRNHSLLVAKTLSHAPESWKKWLDQGHRALFRFTRRVAKQRTLPKIDQRPAVGSSEEKALQTIYKFYTGKNHRFELLAAEVAHRILSPGGSTYHRGWVTPRGGDGGADFISRLDLGSGFATTKVVVLGQAKCESPQVATSGRDIARTVARLRRGWIGVYVTTSFFSEMAQQEVIEDQYPIVLVHC
jgi:Restriction endonuclease